MVLNKQITKEKFPESTLSLLERLSVKYLSDFYDVVIFERMHAGSPSKTIVKCYTTTDDYSKLECEMHFIQFIMSELIPFLPEMFTITHQRQFLLFFISCLFEEDFTKLNKKLEIMMENKNPFNVENKKKKTETEVY
jgi:hypothetical protein